MRARKFILLSVLFGCHSGSTHSNLSVNDAAAHDAGITSSVVDAGIAHVPYVLTMIDAAHGWAIFLDGKAPTVESTTSGGASWNIVRPVDVPRSEHGLEIGAAFPDREHAVLAWMERADDDPDESESTRVRIERTEDGGKTWKVSRLVASQPVMNGLSVSFTSPHNGYLQSHIMSGMSSPPGFGPGWSTDDGGATWTSEGVTNTSGGYRDCSTCSLVLPDEPLVLPKPLHCTGVYRTDSSTNVSANMLVDEEPQSDAAGNEMLIARCPEAAEDGGRENFEGRALFVRLRKEKNWRFVSVQPDDASILLLKPDLFWRETSDDHFDASTDGGKTWHAATLPRALANPHLDPNGWDDRATSFRNVATQFVSDQVGIAFLPQKWLSRTDDGGATWRDL